MDTTKKKITAIVSKYVKENREEFELVKEALVMRRKMNEEGYDKHTDMRPLYELPETLHTIFNAELDEQDLVWFKSKKGGNWFAKEFKVFSLI